MWNNQNNKKIVFLNVKLRNLHFKLDVQKVNEHSDKWLIHGTKRRKDNQLQSQELPCRLS